ncbi:hypothetical protein QAD02_018915 [Eretmocerus hayati]|uniref:Uncharacterized protein n=1 Tax=Eretmocerus hayati TaxID=131215 RepID=A0ACC2PI52_9HYME|nr:hypothetical protein QAD02_018915 [Eretmocerus hayati]
MPKDNTEYIRMLQKQRTRAKAQAVKYTPATITLQVIGNGGGTEPRSVFLITDHSNYLFNCGEGSQRLAAEHHVKLTKIENIFVTRPVWKNMGGLPGFALTIQDTGVPSLRLHGAPGIGDLIESTKNFIVLHQLELLEADTTKDFTDHAMNITYVPLKDPKRTESDDTTIAEIMLDNVNYYDYVFNSNGKRARPSREDRKLMKTTGRVTDIMCYICKLHPKAGALDFEKCLALGIGAGPHLGRLKAGEDVTMPDGKFIKSSDVVSSASPGPIVIVLECPDEDWIDVVTSNAAFSKYQESTVKDDTVSCIVHFTPDDVLNNPRYQDWMRKFGPTTEHLIINEKNVGVASEAMHKMQHQLHLIHPTIFPLFKDVEYNNPVNEGLPGSSIESNSNDEPDQKTETNAEHQTSGTASPNGLILRRCQTGNAFNLRPHDGFQPNIVELTPKKYIQDALEIDGFLDSLADLQTRVNAQEKLLADAPEYPKLVMLGTGSSIPNKVRNTSGILLQFAEDKSMILDCGESTAAQITRAFGKSESERIFKTIKAVYVSHLHADHHLGLIGILKERGKYCDEPVFLLAPHQIIGYLDFYHNRFEPIRDWIKLVSNRDILLNQPILASSTEKDLYEALDVASISTTFVAHCSYAYGVAITMKDGRKICYSGDTMPSDNLVKLGDNSFLLIHEATMEDGLENEALTKRHSTISQAINAGVKTNSEFTLLTHFSQRYSKLPVLPSNADLSQVGISYDFMKVSLSKLSLLPLFYPSLNILFTEFRALLDERAMKRELSKEWVKKAT